MTTESNYLLSLYSLQNPICAVSLTQLYAVTRAALPEGVNLESCVCLPLV